MSLNETENSKETNNIENDDIVLSNVMISEPNEKNGNKKLLILEDHKNDFKENQKEKNLDNENYFSEIKQKLQNLDEKDKKIKRSEILYQLHKKYTRQREDICEKAEMEKLEKDLVECTFSPKIIKMNNNMKKPVEIQLKNTANQNYVDKKKKQREQQYLTESENKHKAGTGNNWTRDLTIPCEINLKTEKRVGVHSPDNNSYHKDKKEPINKDKNLKVKLKYIHLTVLEFF
jgi:hypothetical protein